MPTDLGLLKTHIENAVREKNMIAHALFNSEPLDADRMYKEYADASRQIAPFVCDTAVLLNQALADGHSVMFEGAQGTMLDIDHGTYPFVSSSSATSGGAVRGTGVAPTAIDTVIGITKAYCTRVGGGPFPTEALDAVGDQLRARGNEFGAVTGRPRRCGWLDLPLLRYAGMINSSFLGTFAQFDCIGVAGRLVPVWNQPPPPWLELEKQQAVVHFEHGEEPRILDSFSPVGGNMAFRRAAFEKYGLFRVDLGKKPNNSGLEDAEFGARLLKGGEKILYAPQAKIYHPVEPAHVRKNYVLRWAYSEGRHQIRSRLWPQDATRYFGIPRFLLGRLLRNLFGCAVTRDKKRRFQHRLHVYRALGGISEAWRLEDSPVACYIPMLETTSASLKPDKTRYLSNGGSPV